MSKHRYGLIFWTGSMKDDEIWTYFEATDYFDAEEIAEKYTKPGYTKGALHYVEANDISYYTIQTGDFCK